LEICSVLKKCATSCPPTFNPRRHGGLASIESMKLLLATGL